MQRESLENRMKHRKTRSSRKQKLPMHSKTFPNAMPSSLLLKVRRYKSQWRNESSNKSNLFSDKISDIYFLELSILNRQVAGCLGWFYID